MSMRVASSLCVLVSLAVIAAGCGQKGPLVLPDAQHPRKKAKLPALHGAPAAPRRADGARRALSHHGADYGAA